MKIIDQLAVAEKNLEIALDDREWIGAELALIGLRDTLTLLKKGYHPQDELKGILKNNFQDPESCPLSGSKD